MKKLLTILSSFALSTAGISTLVASNKAEGKKDEPTDPSNSDLIDQQKVDHAVK